MQVTLLYRQVHVWGSLELDTLLNVLLIVHDNTYHSTYQCVGCTAVVVSTKLEYDIIITVLDSTHHSTINDNTFHSTYHSVEDVLI